MKKRNTVIILVSACLLLSAAVLVRSFIQYKYNGGGFFSRLEYSTGNTRTITTWPGEFEKQQAIWLQWPSSVYNQGSRPVNPVMISIIKAFDPYIRVNVMSISVNEITQIKDLLKRSGYTGTNTHFYVINHLSIWARDVGPIFVKDNKYKLTVVDFGFNNYNRYGNQTYINTESQVDALTAKALGLPIMKSSLVTEGGGIESNGKGVLMTTESVTLARNPGMTKAQIENEYKRVLGIKKVIWLKKGLAEDDRITKGHINEIARFANPDTILLASILPNDRYANWASKESYIRMEENFRILQNATDQNGRHFRIIRVPMPPSLYQEVSSDGNIAVRSYLNYAATNGAVLMQTYWKTGRPAILKETENGVREIFQGVFPGRKIIGIDAENVNQWGGGLHCITQHMPAY